LVAAKCQCSNRGRWVGGWNVCPLEAEAINDDNKMLGGEGEKGGLVLQGIGACISPGSIWRKPDNLPGRPHSLPRIERFMFYRCRSKPPSIKAALKSLNLIACRSRVPSVSGVPALFMQVSGRHSMVQPGIVLIQQGFHQGSKICWLSQRRQRADRPP
jgi:hypothetical protein